MFADVFYTFELDSNISIYSFAIMIMIFQEIHTAIKWNTYYKAHVQHTIQIQLTSYYA